MTQTLSNPLSGLKCLDGAIAHFGTKAELARAMETTAQNVQNWIKKGTIPAANALQVERASGGKVKARDILLENETVENTKP